MSLDTSTIPDAMIPDATIPDATIPDEMMPDERILDATTPEREILPERSTITNSSPSSSSKCQEDFLGW